MNPFTYSRATDATAAVAELAGKPAGSRFLAGGTNLIDLAKMGVEQPPALVDINALPLAEITELPNGGLRIGALARNSDTANHPLVRSRYPVLSEALLAGASPQLRNAATTGGNLLQRTRCYYFYDPAFPQCNKRVAGSGCGALEGYNRIHAILGQSEQCIATNPSDMNVALAALDAVVQIQGAKGNRSVPIADFHRLPGDTPQLDTNLQPGELITSVDLPAMPAARRSHYLKVRDRASYAFALGERRRGPGPGRRHHPSGARRRWAASPINPGVRRRPRPRSWGRRFRTRTALPRRCRGRDWLAAKGYEHNRFKIELAKRTLVRAVQNTAAMSA